MVFYRAKFLRYEAGKDATPWYALAAHNPGEEPIWLNVKGSDDPAVVDEAIKRAEEANARGEVHLSDLSRWRPHTSAYVPLPKVAATTG